MYRAKRIAKAALYGATHVVDRVFWRWVWLRYVGRQPFWLTDKYNVTLRVYPEDLYLPTVLKRLLETCSHMDDESVMDLMQELAQPGMTVVDAGAHHGEFALFAAQFVGNSGQIHAFEPVTHSFNRLCENVAHAPHLARRVQLKQAALSDESGMATMYVFQGRQSAWNSLAYQRNYDALGMVVPAGTEEVDLITLDEYCAESAVDQIDILKVDVEGFELEVLEGASRMIRAGRILNIIFEISAQPLKGVRRTAQELLKAISDMDFRIYRIAARGRVEEVLIGEPIPPFANYFGVFEGG